MVPRCSAVQKREPSLLDDERTVLSPCSTVAGSTQISFLRNSVDSVKEGGTGDRRLFHVAAEPESVVFVADRRPKPI